MKAPLYWIKVKGVYCVEGGEVVTLYTQVDYKFWYWRGYFRGGGFNHRYINTYCNSSTDVRNGDTGTIPISEESRNIGDCVGGDQRAGVFLITVVLQLTGVMGEMSQ